MFVSAQRNPHTVARSKPQSQSRVIQIVSQPNISVAAVAITNDVAATKSEFTTLPFPSKNKWAALVENGLPTVLENSSQFIINDEPDTVAFPDVNFEIALNKRLPLSLQTVILEFWIGADGSTVQIKCIEGPCNTALDALLASPADLQFSPAIKGGRPVSSRKLMQIELHRESGL